MRSCVLALAASFTLLFSSCANKPAAVDTVPRATVILRDGSSYTGKVTATTPAQITLLGDDGQTRTLNLPNVKSVQYSEAPPVTVPPAPVAAGQPVPVPEPEHPEHYHPEPSMVVTKTHEVPAGAQISVRTEETIDSRRAVEGQTFASEVTRNVLDADGAVVIPRGSNALVVIRSASKGGHIRGASDLVMDLASVSIGGQQYRLDTNEIVRTGKKGIGANRRTGKFLGGGAAIGAIIGAIAGGGKGAAIGAASGAGAGATTEILTKGSAVRVPVESVLTFRLEAPLRVTQAE